MYVASDSSLEIVGQGRVRIQFPDGRIKGIDGIMHILGLAQNLLYVSHIRFSFRVLEKSNIALESRPFKEPPSEI